MTENHAAQDLLSGFVNQELSSIEFVRDYMQFRVKDYTLSAITDPEIMVEGKTYARKSKDFCYFVLQCIGKLIISVDLVEEDSMRLHFSNGYLISISLKPENYISAEAVIINSTKNGMNVW